MHRLSVLFAFLFVVPLLGSDSPKEYDDGVTHDVEGTWQLVHSESRDLAGVVSSSVAFDGAILVFRNGAYDSQKDGVYRITGRYRLDTSRQPCCLDMTSTDGIKVRYICRVDNYTLRIAKDLSGHERPRSLDERTDFTLYVFERAKK